MSDAQYADALRVIMLVGSYEYISDPDVEGAREIRKRTRERMQYAGMAASEGGVADAQAAMQTNFMLTPWLAPAPADNFEPTYTWMGADRVRPHRVPLGASSFAKGQTTTVSRVAEPGSIFDPATPWTVFSPDERMVAHTAPLDDRGLTGRNRTSPLYSSALAVSDFTGVYLTPGASSQLSNRHTALTAAHVVVDLATGLPRARRPKVSGVVSKRDLSDIIVSQDFLTGIYDCFVTYWPYYYTVYGNANWDFAAFDFQDDYTGCEQRPGDWAGYYPPAIGNESDYYNNAVWMTGYDRINENSSGNDTDSWRPYTAPTGITRNGGNFSVFVDNDPAVLRHVIDTMNGASGSGLLQLLFWARLGNPQLYYTGTHLSGAPSWNLAKRFDWNVMYLLYNTHDF